MCSLPGVEASFSTRSVWLQIFCSSLLCTTSVLPKTSILKSIHSLMKSVWHLFIQFVLHTTHPMSIAHWTTENCLLHGPVPDPHQGLQSLLFSYSVVCVCCCFACLFNLISYILNFSLKSSFLCLFPLMKSLHLLNCACQRWDFPFIVTLTGAEIITTVQRNLF
jgi:hypothetical protein